MRTDTATAESYFATLRICVLASIALLVATTVLRLPPWVPMVGGAAPLFYYHRVYLTPRAKHGLSQAAIDSVYYFGFLVTVAALAVSAVSLALADGKVPLKEVAFQFGLGLFATAYAVWARMHLTSISSLVEEASPEAVLDRYVQRSRELVTNVELASEQFVSLADRLMARSEDVAKKAQETTQSAMLEAARSFDDQLRGTLASAREGLTEIRGLLQDAGFAHEREELLRSVRTSVESLAALNTALNSFTERSTEGARTSGALAATADTLNQSLSAFATSLGSIVEGDSSLVRTAKSVAEANTEVITATRSLRTVVSELEDMAGSVSGVGPTFKNIRTLTQKANEQMQGLATSTERLDEASQRLTNAANASGALADGMARAGDNLSHLVSSTAQLTEGIEALKSTTSAVTANLGNLPKPAEHLSALGLEVSSALERTAQALAQTSTEAQTLVASAAQHAAALERARSSSDADAASIEATGNRLHEILQSLATDIKAVQTELSQTTTTLNTAVGAATAALEEQVKRSAEVSKVFGERMVDVAQIIIDRTREGKAP